MAEDFHPRDVIAQCLKIRTVAARARDQQIRIRIVAECRDQILRTFDFFQPPREQKIGTLMRTRTWLRLLGVRVWKKVGQHLHLARKAELMMLLAAELA